MSLVILLEGKHEILGRKRIRGRKGRRGHFETERVNGDERLEIEYADERESPKQLEQ